MKIVKLETLQSAPNDRKQNSMGHQKYPIHVHIHCSTPSPYFLAFRSTISRFQDIAHFTIFPLTSMFNFKVPQIFTFLGRWPKKGIAYIPSWSTYLQ